MRGAKSYPIESTFKTSIASIWLVTCMLAACAVIAVPALAASARAANPGAISLINATAKKPPI